LENIKKSGKRKVSLAYQYCSRDKFGYHRQKEWKGDELFDSNISKITINIKNKALCNHFPTKLNNITARNLVLICPKGFL
jgi:hypothetical protein